MPGMKAIRVVGERAGATLRELANLAKKTQVLFFTHHEHLVNAARSLLGEDRMAVVHLEPTMRRTTP